MSLFKNGVGRPSKETIRKRRIITCVIAVVVIALIGSLAVIVKNYLGDEPISSNEKHAKSVIISFSNYSSLNPTLGTNVTLKVNVKNAKNKYLNIESILNGKTSSKMLTCKKIENDDKTLNIKLNGSNTNGTYKYLYVTVYNDKNCKKQITYKFSNHVTWKAKTNPIQISFSGLSTTKPKVGTKIKFSHSVSNAIGYYQQTALIRYGMITYDNCIKITSKSYPESDTFAAENIPFMTKMLRVSIYKDSKCKNLVKYADSKEIVWQPSRVYPTNSKIRINFSNLTKSVKYGNSHNLVVDIYGAAGYYFKTAKYSQRDKNNNTVKSNCYAITKSSYRFSEKMSASKVGAEKLLAIEVYSDSNCTRLVAGNYSPFILRWY